jgi:hypothetical protein
MKKVKLVFLSLVIVFTAANVLGQANPGIAVAPSNNGQVAVGAINELTITISNSLAGSIAVSKLRPIITVPSSVNFSDYSQQLSGLPAGWTILSNNPTQLRVCNSGDVIEGNGSRTILLKVQGITVAPATTFSGQMNFGNGTTCTAGTSVAGNVTADDFGTSTIEVTPFVVPLSLLDFNATIINCEPSLRWTTASEINTDRFEIEKSNINASSWKSIGNVAASGYSSSKINYNFTDKNLNALSEKVLYRLKMLDKDGSFKYSKILPVLVNCKTATILVYPNPVKDGKLYVSLAGTVGYVEANLMAMSGQVIVKKKLINGTNDINVSNIAEGIYMLHIKDANGFDKNIKVSIGH